MIQTLSKRLQSTDFQLLIDRKPEGLISKIQLIESKQVSVDTQVLNLKHLSTDTTL